MAAGSVALFGAPTTAQVDPGSGAEDEIPVTVPLSVNTATGDPYASDHRRPSISADGTIVVFEAVTAAEPEPDPDPDQGAEPDTDSDPDGDPGTDADSGSEPTTAGDAGDTRIVVADRLAGTIASLPGQRVDTDPPGTVTTAPAVSGDGCRVAFSAPLPAPADEPGTPATVELRVADRCGQVDREVEAEPDVDADPDTADASAPAATVVDAVPAPGRFAVPALSADGTTIAWSTGQEVRRYELDPAAGTWGLTDRIDATPPSATTSPDPATDQPDTLPTGADPTSDDRVTHDTVALSADGDTLAFAAGPGGVPFAPEPANVFVWSISSGTPTIDLASMTAAGTPGAADSLAPSLSADGQLLVFESSSTDLAAVGDASAVTAPFVVMLERGQGTGVLASDARQPVISADGRHVAHTRAGALVRTTWVSGTPFAVTTDIEVAPVPPLSRPSVSQHGRWVVFDSDAGAALTDDERFAEGEHVWIADLRPDGSVPDVTTTTATTDPPVTDPTTSGPTTSGPTTSGPTTSGPSTSGPTTSGPTTSGPTTTDTVGGGVDAPVASTSPPQSTVPIGTLPPEFSFPPLRLPSSPPPTSPPRTGTSSSGTSSTGTAPAPEPPPTFDLTDVRFADTIAAAGRSTATVTLSNPGADRVNVSALRIEPSLDSPFAIVSETCTATPLPASGTCSVELEFRPLVAGTVTATLIADTDASSGAVAVVLTGDGIGPPVLDVVPDVAMPGQVVTVFGSGFPAGATVDFTWGLGTSVSHADAQTDLIDVDADGSFAHVVVVLPNTMPGPVPVRVPGQVDLFGDVEAELLVSGSRGSFSAAVRAGSTFAR